jgi:hypothetical protein
VHAWSRSWAACTGAPLCVPEPELARACRRRAPTHTGAQAHGRALSGFTRRPEAEAEAGGHPGTAHARVLVFLCIPNLPPGRVLEDSEREDTVAALWAAAAEGDVAEMEKLLSVGADSQGSTGSGPAVASRSCADGGRG